MRALGVGLLGLGTVGSGVAQVLLRKRETLARRIGRPKAVRAVGLANGQNPISIVVPCHRVIGSDGSLTGYGGGLNRKKWLLKHEGVPT